jgi:hypothetical protein
MHPCSNGHPPQSGRGGGNSEIIRRICAERRLQFQPDRDFPALAAIFLEPQHMLLTVVLEILEPQLGDRPRPAGVTGQWGEDRPISQAHDADELERRLAFHFHQDSRQP